MKTTNLEKLIADNKWRDISEHDGKRHNELLRINNKMAIGDYSKLLDVWKEQWGGRLKTPSHFRPIPDDRLAEVCEMLLEALEWVIGYGTIESEKQNKIAENALQRAEEIVGGE